MNTVANLKLASMWMLIFLMDIFGAAAVEKNCFHPQQFQIKKKMESISVKNRWWFLLKSNNIWLIEINCHLAGSMIFFFFCLLSIKHLIDWQLFDWWLANERNEKIYISSCYCHQYYYMNVLNFLDHHWFFFSKNLWKNLIYPKHNNVTNSMMNW